MKLDRRRGGGRDTAGGGAGAGRLASMLYSVCFVWTKRGGYPRVLLLVVGIGMVALSCRRWRVPMTTTLDAVLTATTVLPATAEYDDPHRLCVQNPYGPSLAVSLAAHADEMDTWLEKKVQIERDLNHEYVTDHRRSS